MINNDIQKKFLWVPVMLLSVGFSFGANAQTENAQPTQAQRQQMAAMHRNMAEMHTKMTTCLESNKDLAVCRKEMTKNCNASFGESPMMGKGKMGGQGMGMGMGKMGGQGMGMNRMHKNCSNWMMNPEADGSEATTKPLKK